MTYEELIKVTNGRIEDLDEALQMLTAKDAGKTFYYDVLKAYDEFGKSGNMETFETICDKLYAVTGYRI